jgi:protease IV
VSHKRDLFIGAMIVVVLFCMILIMMMFAGNRAYESPALKSRGDKVAVVELLGPIYGSRRVIHELKQFSRHESVKAFVFRIDSPGGGVAASQEIYESVRRVREKGIPVVASMGTVAASGGYYVACAADTIMANPGTTTGSIGVILETVHIAELLEKIGIRYEVVKSGRYKDIGSPHRLMTYEDRRQLQSYIDDAYDQFFEVVLKGRAMEKKALQNLADGRVFTGRQARELGLVDLLGDYQDAIDLAAQMGGIEGEPVVVRMKRRELTLLDFLLQEVRGILLLKGMSLKYALL